MINKNYKQLLKLILEKNSENKGILSVKGVNGTTYYLSPAFTSSCFPYVAAESFVSAAASAGISIGSGDTAATENDANLESTITSGVSVYVLKTFGSDNNGDPFIDFDLIIKNTGSNNVTINEIGYKQTLYTAASLNGAGSAATVCLIDRTVLQDSVVIAPGEYGCITYTLSTTDSSNS